MSSNIQNDLFRSAGVTATRTAASRQRGSGSIRRLLLRSAVGVVCGAVALVAWGTLYEAASSAGDASTYPATGRWVEVDGHDLYLECRGEGSPTVVMDAGLGGSSLDWSLVQSDIAAKTRVCSYDRAGMGRSESGPLPRTPARLAGELHTLLEKGGLPGPYVLVGHSLAGKTIRLFAAAHPDEMAGLVLVDARSEYVDGLLPASEAGTFGAALQAQGLLYSVARRIGLARAFAITLVGEDAVPPAIATQMVLQKTEPGAIEATTAEGLARTADDVTLATAMLGSLPLVVIAADASLADLPNWREAQERMAGLSTRGRLVVAAQSSHDVQLNQPTVVVDAIGSVVADVRNGF